MLEKTKLDHENDLITEVIKYLGYEKTITSFSLINCAKPDDHMYSLRLVAPQMELDETYRLLKIDSNMRKRIVVLVLQFTEFIGPGDGW